MELQRPTDIWKVIAAEMSIKQTSASKKLVLSYLEFLRKPVLLVIDEFENLIHRTSRAIAVDFLILPSKLTKLCLIAISNRVDLPNNILNEM